MVGEAIERTRLLRMRRSSPWNDEAVLEVLTAIAKRAPTKSGGLMVFIDEMGKFLQGAAHDGTDVYFFQELAEIASRSGNRLIVVGVLHQRLRNMPIACPVRPVTNGRKSKADLSTCR